MNVKYILVLMGGLMSLTYIYSVYSVYFMYVLACVHTNLRPSALLTRTPSCRLSLLIGL